MADGGGKPVIGLVGGVGSGKSTAAEEFARLGLARIDADRIAHEVLAEDEVRRWVRGRWGPDAFDADGQVDRSAVARIVFADPVDRRALEAVVHPRVRGQMERRLAEALADSSVPAVVVDAPVLLEAGCGELCTHLLFVDAPDEVRAERVRTARGWDRRAWRLREKSQIALDKKLQACYAKVDNSSSVSHLREQVRHWFRRIVQAPDCP